MRKVSELIGAELDYWCARAEGIPADQLEIRPQPMGESICVRTWKIDDIEVQKTLAYSTSWEDGGPLIERKGIQLFVAQYFNDPGGAGFTWFAETWTSPSFKGCEKDKPLIAAMRALVASRFGEELPE